MAPWILKHVACHYHTEEVNYKGSGDINGIVQGSVAVENSGDVGPRDIVLCPNFDVPGGNEYYIGAMFLTDSKTTEQLLWYGIENIKDNYI